MDETPDERRARLVRRPRNLFVILFNVLSAGIPLILLCAGVAAVFSENNPYIKYFCAAGGIVLFLVCLHFIFPKAEWICSQCREEIGVEKVEDLENCPFCGRDLKVPPHLLGG
ncbi:MAG: hypothetical protein ACYTFG_15400 [Planctomycetota bacterium]|jgi:hypothetical protein